MGDKKGNGLGVREKAVSSFLGIAILKPFKIKDNRGKLLSPSYVPVRGIHNGNITYVEGVQETEKTNIRCHSVSSEGGNVIGHSITTNLPYKRILHLNLERKRLNKKIRN